jgi:hypothetical protein
MLMFLLSLVFVATAFIIGTVVVRAISVIPLSILARAAEGGRYARLGLRDPPSSGRPTAGRRTPPLHGARAHAFMPAAAGVR